MFVSSCVLTLSSLSIKRFWGKGERWKRKTRASLNSSLRLYP